MDIQSKHLYMEFLAMQNKDVLKHIFYSRFIPYTMYES